MDSHNYYNSFWFLDSDHLDAFDNFSIILSCIENIGDDLKWNEKEIRKFKDKLYLDIISLKGGRSNE